MCSFTAYWISRLAKISLLWPRQSVEEQNIPGPSAACGKSCSKYRVAYLGFSFARAQVSKESTRAYKSNVCGNGDGRKRRETKCNLRILHALKEHGRAGNSNARSENHINWSLLIESLYISCTNERLWDCLQFLFSGFLVNASGVPQMGACPSAPCRQPLSCRHIEGFRKAVWANEGVITVLATFN